MIPELPAPQNKSQPQFAPQFTNSTESIGVILTYWDVVTINLN